MAESIADRTRQTYIKMSTEVLDDRFGTALERAKQILRATTQRGLDRRKDVTGDYPVPLAAYAMANSL